jgi:hypothetical protein
LLKFFKTMTRGKLIEILVIILVLLWIVQVAMSILGIKL